MAGKPKLSFIGKIFSIVFSPIPISNSLGTMKLMFSAMIFAISCGTKFL